LAAFDPNQARDAHGRWDGDNGDPTKPAFQPSLYSANYVSSTVAGQIKDGVKPSIITIRTNDFGALRSTQSELKPFDGEVNREPLFLKYFDKPVILDGWDGNYHVLDGHNRISNAVRNNVPIQVYAFKEKSPKARGVTEKTVVKPWQSKSDYLTADEMVAKRRR
jgi:hypothetical protein